jgi:hypothetical protein
MGDIKAIKSSSTGKGIPEGAEILKKETTIRVEKIENGYLVCKNTEVKYQLEERTDWAYIDKKYFSKTDPMQIKLNGKSLADDFE